MLSLLRYRPGAVTEAIEACHGLAGLPGQARVVIKPNLCLGGRLVRALPGMTTSVRVVEEIVQLLRDHGVAEIAIAEGTVPIPSLGSSTTSAFREAGYLSLARRYGVELVDLNAGPFTRRIFERRNLYIAKRVLECDFLVNAPCLKTHILTRVSLGLKNTKGVLKPENKRYFHRHDLERLVAGLNTIVRSDLVVVDGQLAMERGPDSDRVKPAGLVIAGTDPLEVDAVGCRLLGLPPAEVAHVAHFAQLHRRRLDAPIEVQGLDVDEVTVPCLWRADDETALYADHGVSGFAVAQDRPITACSGCRAALHAALEGFRAHNRDLDLGGVEIVMGQNRRCLGDHLGLHFGDCALRQCVDDDGEFGVAGCPPDIYDVYQVLAHVQRLGKR